jgi:hypothetical protein
MRLDTWWKRLLASPLLLIFVVGWLCFVVVWCFIGLPVFWIVFGPLEDRFVQRWDELGQDVDDALLGWF